jgi:hypothetical protein
MHGVALDVEDDTNDILRFLIDHDHHTPLTPTPEFAIIAI